MKGNISIVSFVLVVFCLAGSAAACPHASGLINYRCRSKLKLMFTGDSFAYGREDGKNNEGYVGRTRDSFPLLTVTNLGVPGITARRLLIAFKKNYDVQKKTTKRAQLATVCFLDVGRNGYFDPAQPTPALVERNIRRLRGWLESNVGCHVEIMLMPLTRRQAQNPYVSEINRLLKKDGSLRKRKNGFVRFDTLSLKYISKASGIHFTTKGYNKAAKILKKYINGKLQTHLAEITKDTDGDGLFDNCEADFGTDPTLIDTDGDSKSDFAEQCTLGTDPLDPAS